MVQEVEVEQEEVADTSRTCLGTLANPLAWSPYRVYVQRDDLVTYRHKTIQGSGPRRNCEEMVDILEPPRRISGPMPILHTKHRHTLVEK